MAVYYGKMEMYDREKAHEFYIKLGFDKRAFTISYIF
jgi:hypothetical protein